MGKPWRSSRWSAFGLALLALGCGAEGSTPVEADATDAGLLPGDAATQEGPRDQGGRCPLDDVPCRTRGYAHFVISNVPASGLPNPARYEVGEELVTDATTGLVWQRRGDEALFGWQEAREHCAALTLAGRDDFRMPMRIELVTLLDFDELPVVAAAFERAAPDYHWTSSRPSFAPGSAYSVYFGAGETTIADASPGRARALCVAGTIRSPGETQFRAKEGEVLDLHTGLTWEQGSGRPLDWQAAADRCADLGLRLPSVRELQSLVLEAAHGPAIDGDVFPETQALPHWTATLRGTDPWTVDFADGKTYADRLASEQLAHRCVR